MNAVFLNLMNQLAFICAPFDLGQLLFLSVVFDVSHILLSFVLHQSHHNLHVIFNSQKMKKELHQQRP